MGKKLTSLCLALTGLLFTTTHLHAGCGQSTPAITNLQVSADTIVQLFGVSASGDLTGYFFNGSQQSHAFTYMGSSLIDAGTLGGQFSEAYAVNSGGVLAGDAMTDSGDYHAMAAQGTNIVDLGTLGGNYSSASLINDAGLLVGVSALADNSTYDVFAYSNGVMTDLGNLGGGDATPTALNHRGDIAGYSSTAGGELHAFLYTGGVMTDLGTLGGDYSLAQGLNDSGIVVGESTDTNGNTHGFIYTGGAMVDMGTFGGSTSTAVGVNSNGQFIGYSALPGDSAFHAFIGTTAGLVDLGTLGGPSSFPSAINNLGQVVGSSDTAEDGGHAFLWDNGTMTDLNTLVAGSGWVLTDALFINDAGRISGNGLYNGMPQPYILDLASSDTAPAAVAGPDQAVECGTPVLLDGTGSVDPDGDSLSYQWVWNGSVLGATATLSASLPVGTNVVTLFVTDPCGMASQADVHIIVADHTAPSIVGTAAPVQVSVGADCNGIVPNVLRNFQFLDGCAAAEQLSLSQTPAAGTVLTKGSYMITVTATDPSGNSNSVFVPLTLKDTTAPVIKNVAAIPCVIWSPIKILFPIVVGGKATDNCDARVRSMIVSITANEPVGSNDILITGRHTALLAASANRNGNGRVYTITVRATDDSGNSSISTTTVCVPKLNGRW